MAKYPQVEALFADHLPIERAQRTTVRQALEEQTGVTNATISRWVTGEMRPHREHWTMIADVLHVDVATVEQACEKISQPTDDVPSRVELLEQAVEQLQMGLAQALRRLDAIEQRGEASGDQ